MKLCAKKWRRWIWLLYWKAQLLILPSPLRFEIRLLLLRGIKFCMERIRQRLGEGDPRVSCFLLDGDGVLWFKNRLVVPKDFELRRLILDEAHLSWYSIHPGSNKMYQDLKQRFWWTRMKQEIANYVSECDICRRVKASHFKPAGMLQPLDIPSWK